MWLKLWKLVHKQEPPPADYTTCSTSPGDLEGLPDTCFPLWLPQLEVQHAITGPGAGVADLQDAFGDLDILWQQQSPEAITATSDSPSAATSAPPEVAPSAAADPQDSAGPTPPCRLWGCATSLYDIDPTTGRPAGEPVADIYAGVQLPGGCSLLAVADGVNWGERPRRAARAAVYGVLRHMLVQLLHKCQEQEVNSNQVLSVMRQALSTAQRLILSTEGTLTTLVVALVAPTSSAAAAAAMCAAAGSTGTNHKQAASAAASRHGSYTGRLGMAADKQQQQPFVVCTMAVGDSPAYVWRQRQGVVEELTAAGRHAEDGGHRDPRMCPGCLGYASGEDPDLTNLTLSVTHIEAGDVVYLTSDGIADNFDPVVCKRAVASSAHLAGTISYSPGSSAASHKELLLGEVAGEQQQLVAVSPLAAHQLALEAMAALLNNLHGGDNMAAQQAAAAAGGCQNSTPQQLEGLAGGGGSSSTLDQLGGAKEPRSSAASALSQGLSKLCMGAQVKHAADAAAPVPVPSGASSHVHRGSASSTSSGSGNAPMAAAAAAAGTGTGTSRAGSLPLVSSAAVGKALIDHVQQLTAPHRALIEERSRQVLAMQRQRQQQQDGDEARCSSSVSNASNSSPPLGPHHKLNSNSSLSAEEQFLMDLASVPGKLDHATVLAFSP